MSIFYVLAETQLEPLLFYRSTIPTFHPEYGRYMLESTPGAPYTGALKDLMSVESNMRYRCVQCFTIRDIIIHLVTMFVFVLG